MKKPHAETLRQAADIIEKRGWTRFRAKRPSGERCMMGVYLENDDTLRWHSRGASAWSVVVDWNNNPKRTAEEVIDTFRTVANLHDVNSAPVESKPVTVEVA